MNGFLPRRRVIADRHPRCGRGTRSRAVFACLAGGITLVAGCAQFHPQPISAAANATTLDERGLDNPRLRKFIKIGLETDGEATPSSRWDLPALTLAALYYHPDLDIARAKLAGAKAGAVTAAQRPNPTLSFQDLGYNATIATPSPWAIAPVINFLIETADKREYRTAAAQHLTEAARRDLATAAWTVRGGVRTALLDLWAARRRLALMQQRLELQGQLVGFLERQHAMGEVSALDLSRERLMRNQIELALRDTERQEADSRARLAGAIGIPNHALDGIDLSFDEFDRAAGIEPLPRIGTLRRQALLGRSDVQALLEEYAAAQSALQLQIARQYPDVTLSPGYGYDAGSNVYLLLSAVELPIFNQNQGPIAEAEARRQEAAARFTALQAQIIGAIDSAAANYGAAIKTLSAASSLLAGERSRESRLSRSLRAGEIDRPALVTAKLERVTAEISRLDAVVQQRQALGRLEDALQQPLFDPASRIFAPETNPRTSPEPT
ncbi:MAG TPA: TolC family protein [Acetobacteraceae bacterium]|jgi:outer membrane protein, heavy metal efflux system|nr:TolC family protein [Acetobacteraceae bacterium]